MASILEQLTSMLDDQALKQIGGALGVDPDHLKRGLAVATPLVLGMLARKASTPDGTEAVTRMAEERAATAGPADIVGGVLGAILGGAGRSSSTDLLDGVMSPGISAISGTLSRGLGFDVQPILTLAAPLVVGVIGRMLKSGQITPAQLATTLQAETNAFMTDPANTRVATLLTQATQAGEQAEALRAGFSDDEWQTLRMAPVAATYLVATASPSKGVGHMQEVAAAVETVQETLRTAAPTSLLSTVYGGGLSEADLAVLAREAPPQEKILDLIADAMTLVSAKSPAEGPAFKRMMERVAANVATAAKEGGFLGIGGRQVSPEEAAAVEAITAALSR